MIQYYPILLEAIANFQIYSKQLIAENKGEACVITPEDETVALAEGYHLEKRGDDFFVL